MVTLRPFNVENAEIHFEWNNDEELNYYDSDLPHEVESYDSFLHRINNILNNDMRNFEWFEIHTDEDYPKLIGIVDIYNIDPHNKRCDLDCSIGDRDYRGKGYGKAALFKALAYCFDYLDMHKVNAYAFDFNEKWKHLMVKSGFKEEGILRNHTFKKKRFHNKHIFGLLKEEFDDLRSKNFPVSKTG